MTLLIASVSTEMLASLAAAVPVSVLTVAVSWQAILRKKVEAQVKLQYEREKTRFTDELQKRRELAMRMLENEMLERLDAIMSSAYRARNAVRDLSGLGLGTELRAGPLGILEAEGRTFHNQIMENRVRLTALSSFAEAHALKNALLAVLEAEQDGRVDLLAEEALLVESTFGQFAQAIGDVVGDAPAA